MSSKSPSDAPWHLWLVGGILLLYALLAAYDSAMTLSQGEAYMRASGMTGSQLNYFTGLPLWVQIASFVSTWAWSACGNPSVGPSQSRNCRLPYCCVRDVCDLCVPLH